MLGRLFYYRIAWNGLQVCNLIFKFSPLLVIALFVELLTALFVFSDLLQNALIVPLKLLRDHEQYNDFSVLNVLFHPSQPWLFSCGADSTVRLYT